MKSPCLVVPSVPSSGGSAGLARRPRGGGDGLPGLFPWVRRMEVLPYAYPRRERRIAEPEVRGEGGDGFRLMQGRGMAEKAVRPLARRPAERLSHDPAPPPGPPAARVPVQQGG
jgi:hypothetical protein